MSTTACPVRGHPKALKSGVGGKVLGFRPQCRQVHSYQEPENIKMVSCFVQQLAASRQHVSLAMSLCALVGPGKPSCIYVVSRRVSTSHSSNPKSCILHARSSVASLHDRLQPRLIACEGTQPAKMTLTIRARELFSSTSLILIWAPTSGRSSKQSSHLPKHEPWLGAQWLRCQG